MIQKLITKNEISTMNLKSVLLKLTIIIIANTVEVSAVMQMTPHIPKATRIL
jgi:hypothetical protein